MNEAKNPSFMNEANSDAYRNNVDLDWTTRLPDSITFKEKMTLAEILEKYPILDSSFLGVSFAPMTLNEYQEFTDTTKSFPEKHAIVYPALGLAEEAGEVAGKIKKWLRGDTDELDKERVKKEMGDVLWYLASLATDLGITLEDIAKTNMQKLIERKRTGTLKGDGDDREKTVTVNFKTENVTAKI